MSHLFLTDISIWLWQHQDCWHNHSVLQEVRFPLPPLSPFCLSTFPSLHPPSPFPLPPPLPLSFSLIFPTQILLYPSFTILFTSYTSFSLPSLPSSSISLSRSNTALPLPLSHPHPPVPAPISLPYHPSPFPLPSPPVPPSLLVPPCLSTF